MRIVLASSGSGSRGGGEIFLVYLAKALSDRGHSVVLWVPDHRRMDELAHKCKPFSGVVRSDYTNTYDHRIRCVASCFNWHVSRRVAREWGNLSPDLVHINKQNLEDGLDLLRAARWSGLPSVCTIHLTQTARYLHARMPWLRDGIARWQLQRYGGELVAVQHARAIALDEFVGQPSRTRTIFNGVPRLENGSIKNVRNMKRRELGLSSSDFLVLGVGRLVEQKRPFEFLRIAKELHRRVPSIRFLWVGDGELADQWNSAIVQHGLAHVVSCTGWCGDPMPYLLAGDLLLHIARFEGFPLALIEAMSVGLPCAVNRDLSREIPMLGPGTVLRADDVDCLAQELQDPGTLALVAKSGRKLYDDALSAAGMAQAYEELYADTIRRGHVRGPLNLGAAHV
jgi:glycosyltransferase involved in cell wall biosynthesis